MYFYIWKMVMRVLIVKSIESNYEKGTNVKPEAKVAHSQWSKSQQIIARNLFVIRKHILVE